MKCADGGPRWWTGRSTHADDPRAENKSAPPGATATTNGTTGRLRSRQSRACRGTGCLIDRTRPGALTIDAERVPETRYNGGAQTNRRSRNVRLQSPLERDQKAAATASHGCWRRPMSDHEISSCGQLSRNVSAGEWCGFSLQLGSVDRAPARRGIGARKAGKSHRTARPPRLPSRRFRSRTRTMSAAARRSNIEVRWARALVLADYRRADAPVRVGDDAAF